MVDRFSVALGMHAQGGAKAIGLIPISFQRVGKLDHGLLGPACAFDRFRRRPVPAL
jgi:hypothetical protein